MLRLYRTTVAGLPRREGYNAMFDVVFADVGFETHQQIDKSDIINNY